MITLDCENFDSALTGVASLLELPRSAITTMLSDLNEDDWPQLGYGEMLRQVVLGSPNAELPMPQFACWFHSTRIIPSTSFEDGLKPTSEMKSTLMKMMAAIAEEAGVCSKDDFLSLELSGQNAYRIAGKRVGSDDGPHGFLIRENLPKLYLEAPEFVREYCSAIQSNIGSAVLEEYKKRTVPAVVKFRSSTQVCTVVETALKFLYESLSDRDGFSPDCNQGIGHDALTVGPEDVLSVEFLEGEY